MTDKSTVLDRLEVNEALKRMRDLARDPAKRAAMEQAWGKACDKLDTYYLGMKPRPRSFEVHHMNETARYRFACAIAAGHSMDECADLAVSRIYGEG